MVRRSFLAVFALFAAFSVPIVQAEVMKPFDTHRDAEQDFLAAQKQAAAEHKNILLDFGANWCEGCLYQYQVLHEDPALEARLKKNFVVVLVNVNPFLDSKGTKAIKKRYPTKIKTIPRLTIVAPDGTLLVQCGGDDFMIDVKKKNYDLDHAVIARFLDQWTAK